MNCAFLPSAVPCIHPPSRRDNPFATCWTRPGAIAFRFAEGQTAERLVAQLAAQDWWGAIVGPHGSGKSTLLEALQPALIAAGRKVRFIMVRGGRTRLPRTFFHFWEAAQTLLIIDGYEQLSWWSRWRLASRCRRANVGLLVTSHKRTLIPMLIGLAPNRPLIEQLVSELCAEVSTSIALDDVAASHACHGSNVREIFFDLYDRHEQHRRIAVGT